MMKSEPAFPGHDFKIIYPKSLEKNVEFLAAIHEIKVEHKGQ